MKLLLITISIILSVILWATITFNRIKTKCEESNGKYVIVRGTYICLLDKK